MHAAEAKALELTAQRPGDGLSERSFSDPRRPDETENRRLGRRIEFHDAEVFENAFFDVLQIVVVLVEDLPGAADVEDVLRLRRPRQLEDEFEISARDVIIGRSRRESFQLGQLPFDFLANFLR